MPLTRDERDRLLDAIAGALPVEEPAPELDAGDVAEVAAEVAAVVAEEVAEEVAGDDQGDDELDADDAADLIVTAELAHAAGEVEVIEAQADAAVAVIEAEADAEVAVIEAIADAADDQSGDELSPDAGDDLLDGVVAPLVVDADGDGGVPTPDTPPSPSHPWFRPFRAGRS